MTIKAGTLVNPADYLRDLVVASSNVAGITTTETVTDTLVATLVAGLRYKVTLDCAYLSTVAADVVLPRIREDNVAGTILQGYRTCPLNPANAAVGFHIEAYYTATVSGSKTFVGTCIRSAGTGSITRFASGTLPANFAIETW